MAEKKFFVDINLQGSALTNAKIGTNSGIGSTEGAFGYDSSAHRLQYFDGTATKDVANLSDIAAVTGGLIFQGGYDPTTDTPDITDGTALKGFFWVATAAGTFLGESVQVGDSIVAKGNNAPATIADWLILQGNIVIATDSVDGISRLATQTEANDGTEAGAVVITPATLQGKIDAQITPEISSKLPLAGGTMTGGIDMAENTIDNVSVLKANDFYTNGIASKATGGEVYLLSPVNANGNNIGFLPAPTADGDAANKLYVDDQDALKVSKAGDTMSGNLDMGGNSITNGGLISASTVAIETLDPIDFENPIIVFGIGLDFQNGNGIISNLATPTNGGDAANKTYVDGAASTAQANAEATASADATTKANAAEQNAKDYADTGLAAKLDLAGGTMSGSVDMGGNYINNIPTPIFGQDAANKQFVENAAATAQTNATSDANDYTDTGLAAKLDLAGGTMSGAIDMDYQYLRNPTVENATLVTNLNANSQKIISLATPVDGGDAANKTYVDGAAATAESNANVYTDTAVSALSFTGTIEVSGWTYDGVSEYYAYVTHNLNNKWNVVTTSVGEQIVEFNVQLDSPNGILLRTNILPIETTTVSIVNAGGNL